MATLDPHGFVKEEPGAVRALLVRDHFAIMIKVGKFTVSEVPLLLFGSIREVALILRYSRIVRDLEVVDLVQGRREGIRGLGLHFSTNGKVALWQLFLDGLDILALEHAGVSK